MEMNQKFWSPAYDGPWRVAVQQATYVFLTCSVCGIRYIDEAFGRDLYDDLAEASRAATEDGWTVSPAPVVDGPAIHATYAVCDRSDARHRDARDLLMPPMPDLEFGLDGQEPLPGIDVQLRGAT